jgi:hypothetical protein
MDNDNKQSLGQSKILFVIPLIAILLTSGCLGRNLIGDRSSLIEKNFTYQNGVWIDPDCSINYTNEYNFNCDVGNLFFNDFVNMRLCSNKTLNVLNYPSIIRDNCAISVIKKVDKNG